MPLFVVTKTSRKFIKPFMLSAALLLLAFGIAVLANPKTTYAATNQDISFEGKIVSSTGTNISDGSYNVEFTIYTGCTNNTGTGCTAAWKEDYLTSNTTYSTTTPVVFTSGTFQVNLGSICAFTGGSCEGNTNTAINWDTSPLYVSINVGTTAACAAGFTSCGGGTGAMTPYILLTSAPYAMDAANADTLGGIASSGFVQLNGTQSGNINIGTGTISSGLINGQTIAGAASFTTSVTSANLIANTGLYTGASVGTERIDASGNLLAIGNITGAGAVTFNSGGATAVNVDTGGGAAINIGATNATSIVIGGNTSATITDKVANSSATAYTLQTAGGTSLLVANTSSSTIYIGGSTAVATPILLVFGQKNATGDPTGVSGAEYYNSTNSRFRCDQGGTWQNCLPTSNASTASQAVAAASTAYLTGSSISIPGGGLHAGTQFIWRLSATKTAAGTAASSILVKYGTTGTTSDATELTFTGPTETAATDTAQITLILTVQSVSSTGTWTGNLSMAHLNASTGFTATTAQWVATVTSSTFNDTTAGAIVGLAATTGTSDAITFQQVQVEAQDL